MVRTLRGKNGRDKGNGVPGLGAYRGRATTSGTAWKLQPEASLGFTEASVRVDSDDSYTCVGAGHLCVCRT